MMLSKVEPVYSGFRPSFLLTASKRSMSKPTILSLSSRNSFGAYVGSVPTLSVPRLAISAGTSLASVSSFSTDALEEADPEEPSESVLFAHAERLAALRAAAATRPQRRREGENTVVAPSQSECCAP